MEAWWMRFSSWLSIYHSWFSWEYGWIRRPCIEECFCCSTNWPAHIKSDKTSRKHRFLQKNCWYKLGGGIFLQILSMNRTASESRSGTYKLIDTAVPARNVGLELCYDFHQHCVFRLFLASVHKGDGKGFFSTKGWNGFEFSMTLSVQFWKARRLSIVRVNGTAIGTKLFELKLKWQVSPPLLQVRNCTCASWLSSCSAFLKTCQSLHKARHSTPTHSQMTYIIYLLY